MNYALLGLGWIVILWIVFYPNPYYRKGNFRKPGWWNGRWD